MGNEEERQREENKTCEWSTGQVLGEHPGGVTCSEVRLWYQGPGILGLVPSGLAQALEQST